MNQKFGVGVLGVETDGKRSQQCNFHPTFETQGVSDKVCVRLEKNARYFACPECVCLKLLFVCSNNQSSEKFQKPQGNKVFWNVWSSAVSQSCALCH